MWGFGHRLGGRRRENCMITGVGKKHGLVIFKPCSEESHGCVSGCGAPTPTLIQKAAFIFFFLSFTYWTSAKDFVWKSSPTLKSKNHPKWLVTMHNTDITVE